jgi:hypothetical protein
MSLWQRLLRDMEIRTEYWAECLVKRNDISADKNLVNGADEDEIAHDFSRSICVVSRRLKFSVH